MTQDEKLDEALKQTFPASDPFSLAPEKSSQHRQASPSSRAPTKPRCSKDDNA